MATCPLSMLAAAAVAESATRADATIPFIFWQVVVVVVVVSKGGVARIGQNSSAQLGSAWLVSE